MRADGHMSPGRVACGEVDSEAGHNGNEKHAGAESKEEGDDNPQIERLEDIDQTSEADESDRRAEEHAPHEKGDEDRLLDDLVWGRREGV